MSKQQLYRYQIEGHKKIKPSIIEKALHEIYEDIPLFKDYPRYCVIVNPVERIAYVAFISTGATLHRTTEEIHDRLRKKKKIKLGSYEATHPELIEKEVCEWWTDESKFEPEKPGWKWNTLEHNGPYMDEIINPYKPAGLKLKFEGDTKSYPLTSDEERVLLMYAGYKDLAKRGKRDYTKIDIFNKNYFDDFQEYLSPTLKKKLKSIGDFKKIKWGNLIKHLEDVRQDKKDRDEEEKFRDKCRRKTIELKHKYAMVNGFRETMGGVAPRSRIFKTQSLQNKHMGKIIPIVTPDDIVLNLGEEADIPSAPEGYQWNVVHDHNKRWAYKTKNAATGGWAYVEPAGANKGLGEYGKFETVRALSDVHDEFVKKYMKDMKSDDLYKRQMATALYLIDTFGIRIGDAKSLPQDVRGVSTLAVKNVKDVEPTSIRLEFLGKDSIPFNETLTVIPIVSKNIKSFMKGKSKSDFLFDFGKKGKDEINKYIKSIDSRFTAKNFRTRLASITMYEELKKLKVPKDASDKEKVALLSSVNIQVAKALNHRKRITDEKAHAIRMKDLKGKIRDLRKKLKVLKSEGKTEQKQYLDARDRLAQSQATLDELELGFAKGTSRLNYIDPRIIFQWGLIHGVADLVYTGNLETRFEWAKCLTTDDFDYIDTPIDEEAISKSKPVKDVSTPKQRRSKPSEKKIRKSKSMSQQKPIRKVTPIGVPESAPEFLTIKKRGDYKFEVTGKPLKQYSAGLLALGGEYPTASVGGEKEDNDSIILIRGKFVKDEPTRKKLLELGGYYPADSKGNKRKDVIKFTGVALEQNRELLLDEYGGRYPTKTIGSEKVPDHSRVVFPNHMRKKVEKFVFDRLPEEDRLSRAYSDWIRRKFETFIDTASQIAYYDGSMKIDDSTIELVISNIYGCSMSKHQDIDGDITIDYRTIIDDILGTDKYKEFSMTSEATDTLASAVERLGESLLEPLNMHSEADGKNTFHRFQRRLQNIEDWLQDSPTCTPAYSFSGDQICVLRALHNTATCLAKYMNYSCSNGEPFDMEIAVQAFLIVIPPKMRDANGDNKLLRMIIQGNYPGVEGGYNPRMNEEDINEFLERAVNVLSLTAKTQAKMKNIGVVHDLNDVYSVLLENEIKCGFYTSTDCKDADICPASKDELGPVCVVFALALAFMDPFISGPTRNQLLYRRIKAMAHISSETVVKTKVQSKVEIPVIKHGSVVETDGSLTHFTKSEWIAVITTASVKTKSNSSVVTTVINSYPYGDIYLGRDTPFVHGKVEYRFPSQGGQIMKSTPSHRYLAFLIAENTRGGPKKLADTKEDRYKWFSSCLDELCKNKKISSIAFSAEQLEPEGYADLVSDYANKCNVKVYVLTGDVKRRMATVEAGIGVTSKKVRYTQEELEDAKLRQEISNKFMKDTESSRDIDFMKWIQIQDRMEKVWNEAPKVYTKRINELSNMSTAQLTTKILLWFG